MDDIVKLVDAVFVSGGNVSCGVCRRSFYPSLEGQLLVEETFMHYLVGQSSESGNEASLISSTDFFNLDSGTSHLLPHE